MPNLYVGIILIGLFSVLGTGFRLFLEWTMLNKEGYMFKSTQAEVDRAFRNFLIALGCTATVLAIILAVIS